MLSQVDLQVIQTVFGKTAEELSGAISSEQEVSLGLRLNGSVKTPEELQRIKEDAENQGKELRSKELAKELGLTLEAGEKDPVKIAEKLKTNIETTLEEKYKNPEPGEREKELEEKLQAEQLKYSKLNETYESTLEQVQEKEKAYTGLQKEIKTKEHNNAILKTLPEKIKYNRDHALIVINNILETEEIDGNVIYKKDGKPIMDAVGQPEKLEVIIPALAEEFGWVKGKGMNGGDRGGSGSGLPKGLSDDAAMQYIKDRGEDPMSNKGSEMFIELTSKE
jgi:hypothetical protein